MPEIEKPKVGAIIKLTIDRLSIGGRGVGRFGPWVVFIPETIAGEEVEAKISKVKKNYLEAQLLGVLRRSEFRIEPPCPIAGKCGGCGWQHIEYSEQLRQKFLLVKEAMTKFSGLGEEEIGNLVQKVIPSPSEFRYRNRIQVHVSGERIGYHARGTNNLIEIKDCLIAEEGLSARLKTLGVELMQSRDRRSSVFTKQNRQRRIELFRTEQGIVDWREESGSFGREAGEQGTTSLFEGNLFSQVNQGQNLRLIAYVTELCRSLVVESGLTKIYDLYSGNGNFTFPILEALSIQAVAVEINQKSTEIANSKSLQKGMGDRLEIQCSDVAEFLASNAIHKEEFVLLDPPRTGCDPKVLSSLLGWDGWGDNDRSDEDMISKNKGSKGSTGPGAIVYVSCHPVTLARDLKILLGDGKYRVRSLQPFDMFPQTDHVEVVAVLVR